MMKKDHYPNKRNKTRRISIGNISIGDGAPITVQSMTNTKTYDVKSTVRQITLLEDAGCEIVRVAVPDMESAIAISEIKKKIKIPIVADVHFDYKLAVEAIKRGCDGIRINPGNIGGRDKIKKVVDEAKSKRIPMRIGVNSGSLEPELLMKYKKPTPEAMVESALRHVKILEEYDFNDIVISLKSSDVLSSIQAYKLISEKVDYPLHLGITEAGTPLYGTIKSSVGLGILLYEGIGDTIRVSLTGDPIEEVKVGIQILKSLKLRKTGVNIISCPTCGRTQIDLIKMAVEVEERLKHVKKPIKVAVMGCVVNGPGEAREADIGIAGGNKKVAIFKKGNIVKTVPEELAVDELVNEVLKMTD
jgi:(E)-4-hydroxy-3-methylbut-2-enyl-diphosphate synthase